MTKKILLDDISIVRHTTPHCVFFITISPFGYQVRAGILFISFIERQLRVIIIEPIHA